MGKILQRAELNLPAVDAAYIAGIVDGEGSLCIVRMNRGSPKISFRLTLHVTNTDLPLILWLKEKLGGSICPTPGTRKPCWRWYTGGYSVPPILRALRPFLRCKEKQADLAIAFCALRNDWNWERRASMYTEMKRLNGSTRPVRLEPETSNKTELVH